MILGSAKLHCLVYDKFIPAWLPEEDEQLQADLLKQLYTVWSAHPAVDCVVYRNSVDGYCYDDPKGEWLENNCRGGLFHHDLTPKKSAQTLYDLFHKEWHTDLDAVTDETGCVEFRGFFGDYTVETEDFVCTFGLHKNESPVTEIEI